MGRDAEADPASSKGMAVILSGKEILKRHGADIFIDPFNESQINPNSYNLRLHNEFLVYSNPTLDMKESNPTETITIPETGYIIQPNKLYLGRTLERTHTDKFVPMLEGRSSVGRLGICIHVTAGFGDVGFQGYWTLEIFCIHPVRIYPFVEICQIYFHDISGDFDLYSSDKYNANQGIQPSLMWKDFE